MTTTLQHCTVDDAAEYILDFLENPRRHSYGLQSSNQFLRVVIHIYLQEVHGQSDHYDSNVSQITQYYPFFADAAWLLCQRGILRLSEGETTGYTLTQAGRDWLIKRAEFPTFPSDPSRFGALIEQFRDMLGKGFYQRAQEALGCYRFGNYLAACVMAGAATESILLSIAIAKAGGDEKQVLRDYKGTSGTQKIENRITQPLKKPLADPFKDLTALIGYWRNEAAHGEESDISETEAYIAITKLLRFAEFSRRNWTQLTQLSSNPTDN